MRVSGWYWVPAGVGLAWPPVWQVGGSFVCATRPNNLSLSQICVCWTSSWKFRKSYFIWLLVVKHVHSFIYCDRTVNVILYWFHFWIWILIASPITWLWQIRTENLFSPRPSGSFSGFFFLHGYRETVLDCIWQHNHMKLGIWDVETDRMWEIFLKYSLPYYVR